MIRANGATRVSVQRVAASGAQGRIREELQYTDDDCKAKEVVEDAVS